jgi:hypothetical protein
VASPEAAPPAAAAATLALYTGLSSEVRLPDGFEVIVHEVLGHIASAEGVVRTIAELRARPGLTAPDCTFVPRAAGTLIAPTARLDESQAAALLQHASAGASAALDAPPVLVHVIGYPRSALLAPAQLMEWYEFGGAASLPEQTSSRLLFRTIADGHFDGFHLHLRAECGEAAEPRTVLDAYEQDTTWTCVYVRLLRQAVWLPRGSEIRVDCYIDTRPDCPRYSLSAELLPASSPASGAGAAGCAAERGGGSRSSVSFSWTGDGG